MANQLKMKEVATLCTVETGTPSNCIKAPVIRVELVDPVKSNEAWISEVTNLEETPWMAGQTRKVSFRIMSDEFQKHVQDTRPTLQMKYGPKVVGSLEPDQER